MVTTLIKHEALRTRKWLAIVFGAATLLTMVGTLMAYTPWPIIRGLGFMLGLVAVSAFLFVVQLGLAYDYWRSSYSRTGYFTHSLPVSGSTIYGAKLLWGCIISVAALLWNLVLALPVVFAASHIFDLGLTFSNLGDGLRSLLSAAPSWLWATAAVLVLLWLFATVAQYYFAASIGSESKMNRYGIGGPILVWVLLYVVMQVVLFVGIIAIPLGVDLAPDGTPALVSTNFLELMLNNEDADLLPLGFLPVTFFVTGLLIWRTVVSWTKKVSLA